MKTQWLNILNFNQYHLREPAVIERVTEECYLPLTKLLLDRPKAKCIVSITGSLLDLLSDKVKRGRRIIKNLATLMSRGQVEIAATGKYYPIFPLILPGEAERQLSLQEEALCQYLGMQERPTTVFLPELAYLPDQIKLFMRRGYDRLIVDESSLRNGLSLMGRHQLRERGEACDLIVSNRDISEALGNPACGEWHITDAEGFVDRCREKEGAVYIVTATDAEVFGLYEKSRWKLLAAIYDHPGITTVTAADIAGSYRHVDIDTVPSSRATDRDDADENIFYPHWFHPENRIHRMLWQLLDITLEETRLHGNDRQNAVADSLLSSHPFFWASCRPWWDGNLAEKTADSMVSLLSKLEGASESAFVHAESLRNRICEEILSLNRSGRVTALQEEAMKRRGICTTLLS
jgi:hypothetical protein